MLSRRFTSPLHRAVIMPVDLDSLHDLLSCIFGVTEFNYKNIGTGMTLYEDIK
jgi:hypothetical protein